MLRKDWKLTFKKYYSFLHSSINFETFVLLFSHTLTELGVAFNIEHSLSGWPLVDAFLTHIQMLMFVLIGPIDITKIKRRRELGCIGNTWVEMHWENGTLVWSYFIVYFHVILPEKNDMFCWIQVQPLQRVLISYCSIYYMYITI